MAIHRSFGYGLLRGLNRAPHQQQFHDVWKIIWRINAPPKVVNFIWRALRGILSLPEVWLRSAEVWASRGRLHARVDGATSVAGGLLCDELSSGNVLRWDGLNVMLMLATFSKEGAISGVFRNERGRFMGGYVKVLGSFTRSRYY
ncbi:unnamed protein product [Dovyalis caffra]|uniref:Reverse transcriptase zinc-binding domain-containing protein n=1 Tax=Dovyalis caffra TaxID=77055 RepID=A0AAV1SDW7_9ROSI|nr:unnamed protein product [Dovyalis caffra]